MAKHANPAAITTTLRVLSWNLWWRFGPWEQRAKAILATLRDIDADIICLQEVWDDGSRNLAEELAAALGFHFAYAPGAKPNGIFMGNAILSRWPISDQATTSLFEETGAEETRVALYAQIDGPRGKLPIFCTHLNWQMHHSHIRQKQVIDLTRFINGKKPMKYPPILCGDFNADPNAQEMRMLTGQTTCPTKNLVFHDAWAFIHANKNGFTWDNANPHVAQDFEPNRRLDYILVGWPKLRGAGHIVGCEITATTAVNGVQPSDHYAVLAELRY